MGVDAATGVIHSDELSLSNNAILSFFNPSAWIVPLKYAFRLQTTAVIALLLKFQIHRYSFLEQKEFTKRLDRIPLDIRK